MLKSLIVIGTMVATFGACAAYAAGPVSPNCEAEGDWTTTRLDGTKEFWKISGVDELADPINNAVTHNFRLTQIKEAKNNETGQPFCKPAKKVLVINQAQLPGMAKKWLDQHPTK